MRKITTLIFGAALAVLVMAGSAWAQESTTSLIKQLREDTDRFQKTVNTALDRSSIDGTNAEDEINRYVNEFEDAIGKFKDSWEDARDEAKGWAGEVMVRGRAIDRFLKKHADSFNSGVHTDWATVKLDIGRIAKANDVKVKW